MHNDLHINTHVFQYKRNVYQIHKRCHKSVSIKSNNTFSSYFSAFYYLQTTRTKNQRSASVFWQCKLSFGTVILAFQMRTPFDYMQMCHFSCTLKINNNNTNSDITVERKINMNNIVYIYLICRYTTCG